MNTSQKTLVSGIQPTGRPHLGNYFGAMKQFLDYQDEYDSYIFIADLHALTTIQDKNTLKKNTYDLVVDYLTIGLDPDKVTLYKQSDITYVTELTWIFNCLTTVPFLERAHAYKDALESGKKKPSVGLFDYPILMAADILLPEADVVPVGQDQKQHLEYARDTAEAFNKTYGETFKLPEPIIKDDVATVPGLDGQKMSKSYGNTIGLFEETETLEEKVMGLVTDSKGVDEPKNPNDTLNTLFKLVADTETARSFENEYTQGGMGYKEAKERLSEQIEAFIAPLRARREEIAQDTSYVYSVLEEGKKRADNKMEQKMHEVREKVGLTLQ